jgi:hypothetical protein
LLYSGIFLSAPGKWRLSSPVREAWD